MKSRFIGRLSGIDYDISQAKITQVRLNYRTPLVFSAAWLRAHRRRLLVSGNLWHDDVLAHRNLMRTIFAAFPSAVVKHDLLRTLCGGRKERHSECFSLKAQDDNPHKHPPSAQWPDKALEALNNLVMCNAQDAFIAPYELTRNALDLDMDPYGNEVRTLAKGIPVPDWEVNVQTSRKGDLLVVTLAFSHDINLALLNWYLGESRTSLYALDQYSEMLINLGEAQTTQGQLREGDESHKGAVEADARAA